jgi:penicillin-binding protein 1C
MRPLAISSLHRRAAQVAPWLLSGVAAFASVALLATRPPAPPTFDTVRADYRPSEAWLLDRHGVEIDTRRIDLGARRLAWTPLTEISPALVAAVVDGEDRRFWRHAGVDWIGVAGAVRDEWQGRRRGASTITMQLAAMLDAAATPRAAGGRGPAAKLRQMRLALRLGRSWSREQVLEAYLNLLQFRGELQGIRAASALLAGKSPAGLTADEAAVLAALLPHPSARAGRVARRACARAAPPRCEALMATATALLATRATGAALPVEHLAPQLAVSLLSRPGERVRSTLDAGLQRVAREALARQLDGLTGRNVRDGAALVVDNRTGEVLAYVGSAGRASSAAQVDGVRALRQAGSTLKPFLYGMAFEARYLTAASLLDDSPVAIDTASGLYLPRDYDHDYKGPVSTRTALAGSLNVPAVRALMLVGVEAFRDRLNALGYTSIDRDGGWYGFSLALGSAEVSLWEQAQAYRALAQGGTRAPLRLRFDEPATPTADVLAPGAAFLVADVLSDGAARAVTFGLDSALATPYWSAVKTGTSKDLRDNWCVGFTTAVTVAVWVGNFEGDSMQGVSGVSGAAPAWREIMDALHADGAPRAPAPPTGLVREHLRFAGGLEPPREEWFLRGTAPGMPVRQVDARQQVARISNPVNGMVIALDPDIPAAVQRVPLSARGASDAHRLTLDGHALGSGATPVLWHPTSGVHHLALTEPSGRVVDRILFTVR